MEILGKFIKRLVCAIVAVLLLLLCAVGIAIFLPLMIVFVPIIVMICPESWYKGGLSMEVDPDLDID